RLSHFTFWGSPFGICRENVILRRHLGMARKPAFGAAWVKFGGLNVSVSASYAHWAYAHPFVSRNLLVSFSMKETDFRVSGTIRRNQGCRLRLINLPRSVIGRDIAKSVVQFTAAIARAPRSDRMRPPQLNETVLVVPPHRSSVP